MTITQRAAVSWKLALRRLAAGVVMMIAARTAHAAALPAELTSARLQALLQRFVSRVYLKGFRHLGDERDFDHGHVLYGADGRAVAILYHTQELANEHKPGTDFSYIDPSGRNWIQWLDDGDRIENAAAYARQDYPATAAWDFFRAVELPGLEARHTVLPKMLDPKLGVDEARTVQWVFTRKDCAAAPSGAGDIRVVLPTRELVCLGLSAT